MVAATSGEFELTVFPNWVTISHDFHPFKVLINRNSCKVTAIDALSSPNEIPNSYQNISAIVGLTDGILAVVKGKEKVAEIVSSEIWKVSSFQLIALNDSLRYKENSSHMISEVLSTDGLFFSYSYDLTRPLKHQKLNNSVKFQRNPEFTWNQNLLSQFFLPELTIFCIPIIQGFVGSRNLHSTVLPLNYILISRRGVRVAGTRFNARGSDYHGNVANFVETEQIVSSNDQIFSFLQIRGSIPLLWSQIPDLSYKPEFRVRDSPENSSVCDLHIRGILNDFNSVIFVDLLDRRGSESKLARIHEHVVSSLAQTYTPGTLKFLWFDFHSQCRNLNWQSVASFVESLDEPSFVQMKEGVVLKDQTEVIRTNCIDCLDRTNVVQNLLGIRVLRAHLRMVDDSSTGLTRSDLAVLSNIWADHADILSEQYSGTKALKTDFTRLGRRTLRGRLNDLTNSIRRYILNNFMDGGRQDSIDYFTGKLSQGEQLRNYCKRRKATLAKLKLMMGFLVLVPLFLVLSKTLLDFSGFYRYLFSYGLLLVISFIYVITNRSVVVDHPINKTNLI